MNPAGPPPSSNGRSSADLPLRPPISDEPLINALHRHLAGIVLLAYAVLLVYMSFVPFDFARPAGKTDLPFYGGLPIGAFSLRDITANIAVYVPLGMLCAAAWRARRSSWLPAAPLSLAFAGLLSVGVEHGQQWVASRVSSWVDVTSNLLGALLGLLIYALGVGWWRAVARRGRWAAHRNWPLALAKAAVCALVIVQLRPYDPVVDVFHTAAALRHASFHPLASWHHLPDRVAAEVAEGRRHTLDEVSRAQWEYALDRLAEVTAYAAIAFLLTFGLAPQYRRRTALFAWTGFVVFSLAAMITGIRVFLISHGLDTSQLFVGLAGWLVGSPLALAAAPRSGRSQAEAAAPVSRSTAGPAADLLPLPHRAWPAAAVMTLALVLLYEVVPFDFRGAAASDLPEAARFCVVPFLAHFHARPNDAFYDLSGELLRYGLFGMALGLVLRRHSRVPWRRQVLWVTTAAALTAAAAELLHRAMPSHTSDVTTVVLALIGGFSGVVAVRWAADYRRRLELEFADDLLTSQLIEGGTYQPLPQLPKGAAPRAGEPGPPGPRSGSTPPDLN